MGKDKAWRRAPPCKRRVVFVVSAPPAATPGNFRGHFSGRCQRDCSGIVARASLRRRCIIHEDNLSFCRRVHPICILFSATAEDDEDEEEAEEGTRALFALSPLFRPRARCDGVASASRSTQRAILVRTAQIWPCNEGMR